MSNKDHTVLITICILIGLVVTVTVAIIGSIYNNSQNITRDKFVTEHCKDVSAIDANNGLTTGRKYACGTIK